MDNLKLLRVQVAAKVAYLESDQAREDAKSGDYDSYIKLSVENATRAKAFREILRDIDALESL
jgi:hypothetical protein